MRLHTWTFVATLDDAVEVMLRGARSGEIDRVIDGFGPDKRISRRTESLQPSGMIICGQDNQLIALRYVQPGEQPIPFLASTKCRQTTLCQGLTGRDQQTRPPRLQGGGSAGTSLAGLDSLLELLEGEQSSG